MGIRYIQVKLLNLSFDCIIISFTDVNIKQIFCSLRLTLEVFKTGSYLLAVFFKLPRLTELRLNSFEAIFFNGLFTLS